MTYEEYLNKAKSAVKSGMDESIAGVNTRYDTQKTDINTAFEEQVKKTEEQYDSAARELNIQRLIDEKQVAENVSNLGLDNSGFNDTQKTAVQLSYGNRKFSLGKSKTETLGELSQALAQAISENEIKRQTEIEGIKQSYDKLAIDNATSAYNTAQEEYTEQYKASLDATQKAADKQVSAYNDLVEKLLKKDTDALGNKVSVYGDEEKARLIEDYCDTYGYNLDVINAFITYSGINKDRLYDMLGLYTDNSANTMRNIFPKAFLDSTDGVMGPVQYKAPTNYKIKLN